MLVLNRRPGESVIIEPDVHVTVVSVADRRVRISMRVPGFETLEVSAVVSSLDDARLEIGPLGSVTYDGAVRVDLAAETHPAATARAALAVTCGVGERVEVGDDLWVGVASIAKGNPCLAFGGPALGEELRITLIRPAGSYVRLGVEAPNRKVYREELWAAMHAAADGPDGGAPGSSASGPSVHFDDPGLARAMDSANGRRPAQGLLTDPILTVEEVAATPAESPTG